MVVIKLQGGLGNQLFQLSAYFKLSEKYPNIYLDVGDYNLPWNNTFRKYYFDKFTIKKDYRLCIFSDSSKKKLFLKFFNHRITVFPTSLYKSMCKLNIHAGNLLSNDLREIKDNTYVEGYFLNTRFFPENLIDIIQLKNNYIKNKYFKSISNTKSVSVHVRRTDYMNNSDYDGICNIEYYKMAIDFFESKYSDCFFYFFSDDIESVKKDFGNKHNFVFIENSTKNDTTLSDLFLMSSCKYNVIANSTYSWWGAFFNKNLNKIVIRPEKYQNQSDILIFPSEWLSVNKI